MPLYEYLCDKCGGVFELIEKFSDPPKTVHENCGGGVHRLVSAPALQFKGSGWYVNDYAKGNKSGGGKGDSKDGRPDAKPAAGQDSGKSSDSGSSSSTSSSSTTTTPSGGSGSGKDSSGSTKP